MTNKRFLHVNTLCIYTFSACRYSVGDFIFYSDVACDIYAPAVKGLWGVLGVVGIFAASCIVVLLLRLIEFNAVRVSRNLTISLMFCIVCCLSFATLGLLKIFAQDPKERSLGVDPLSSVLFAIGVMTCWIACSAAVLYLFKVQAQMAQMPAEVQRDLLKSLRWVPFWVFLAVFAASFSPVIPLFAGPEFGFGSACVHYLASVATMCLLGGSIIVLLKRIEAHVGSALATTSYTNNNFPAGQFKKLLVRLKFLRFQILSQLPLQVLLGFLLGTWIGLQRFATYQVAFAWFTVTGLLFPAYCYACWPTKKIKNKIYVEARFPLSLYQVNNNNNNKTL